MVDLDVAKPGQAPPEPWNRPGITDGADVLALLAEEAGQPLPLDTFTVRTRRGGWHLYFTHPAGEQLGNTSGSLGLVPISRPVQLTTQPLPPPRLMAWTCWCVIWGFRTPAAWM